MLTSIVISIVILLFFIFFIIYKRDMLLRIFSINVNPTADKFHEQLEQTADTIIKRLETQISRLEYLLAEADVRIDALENQIRIASKIVKQPSNATTGKAEVTGGTMEVTSADSTTHTTVPQYVLQQYAGQKTNDIDSSIKDVNNEKKRMILSMAEQGYNITEIAKATNAGKGEIMLLLQLNRK